MSNVPVLLIAFNRPKFLDESLSSLVSLGVRNVWVHIDAPRLNEKQDEILVSKCSETIEFYKDFFGSLNVHFSEKNLGCKFGPISAIDWFFSEVESGIILEDDIRISSEFISFAEYGLVVFKNSKEIWMLNGWSPFNSGELSIGPWLSRYPVPWGWATWRDRWLQNKFADHYSENMPPSELKTILNSKKSLDFDRYWDRAFRAVTNGFDAWDYEWFHEMWHAGGYAVTPPSRMTANVGFTAQATHTEFPVGRAAFPISISPGYSISGYPKVNVHLDLALDKLMFGMSYPEHEFSSLSKFLSRSHSRKIHNLLIPTLNFTRLVRLSYLQVSKIPGTSGIMKYLLRISSRIPVIAKMQRKYKSKAWFL